MSASKLPAGYRYYKRAFLNREGFHRGAHILAEVHESGRRAKVELSDCYHQIALEFDGYDAASRRNSIRKLNILIESLTRVREELDASYKSSQAQNRRRAPRERAAGSKTTPASGERQPSGGS